MIDVDENYHELLSGDLILISSVVGRGLRKLIIYRVLSVGSDHCRSPERPRRHGVVGSWLPAHLDNSLLACDIS